MWITALCHSEMAKQLAVHWAAMSSTAEFMLRRLLTEAFQVEVVEEQVAEFQKQEKRCSCLERPGMRVRCNNPCI
jgi:hypothetical protein